MLVDVKLLSRIYIKLFGKLVGRDQFANEYYETGRDRYFGRKGRFVLYRGIPEASKVPADWFLWLHYMADSIPSANPLIGMHKSHWEKGHMVNLTGTSLAHNSGAEVSDSENKLYQPWSG